jgi:hypothetical protein
VRNLYQKCDISASNCAITCGPLAHFVQLCAIFIKNATFPQVICAITCGPLAHFVQLCAIFIKNATFPQVIVPLLAALWRILFKICSKSDISVSNCGITCGPLANFVQNPTFPQVIAQSLSKCDISASNCAIFIKMRHFRK